VPFFELQETNFRGSVNKLGPHNVVHSKRGLTSRCMSTCLVALLYAMTAFNLTVVQNVPPILYLFIFYLLIKKPEENSEDD